MVVLLPEHPHQINSFLKLTDNNLTLNNYPKEIKKPFSVNDVFTARLMLFKPIRPLLSLGFRTCKTGEIQGA